MASPALVILVGSSTLVILVGSSPLAIPVSPERIPGIQGTSLGTRVRSPGTRVTKPWHPGTKPWHPGTKPWHPGKYPWHPSHWHPSPQPIIYYETTQPVTVTSNPLPEVEITIVNPPQNGVALNFTIDGQPFSLEPGYQQQLSQECVVEFDRGGRAGQARYRITDGVYTFKPSGGAWDLFHSQADSAGAPDDSSVASNPLPPNNG